MYLTQIIRIRISELVLSLHKAPNEDTWTDGADLHLFWNLVSIV